MSAEMDEQVNPLKRDHTFCVVLPGGLKKNVTVHGSKPVMDLLVTLCASYHLNPSDYTAEFLSQNKNDISFKPNSPVGSLDAETIVLKPKGAEEKMKKAYMPEATVRLLINYNGSHKTVVRVNPRLPLEMLLPGICDKCEFNVATTIILRDNQSQETLDLTKTLNDYGLREVLVKDTAAETVVTPSDVLCPPPQQDLPKKERKQKNRGFFSLFRRRKKKQEAGSVSAPVSPGLRKRIGVRANSESMSSTDTQPAGVPKKRQAPRPPVGVSRSVPNNLSTCHVKGAQGSAESSVRSTKRRAPPPPCTNTQEEQRADADVREPLNSLEEVNETDELHSETLSPSSSSSPHCPQLSSSSSSRPSLTHLHEAVDPFLPSFRGRDLSDARAALARVLTSSLSKGMLVKRLRNSAAFPDFYISSCVSMASDCPDDGGLCAEHKSVLKSDLPTENEWEDPLQKTGLSTFKITPMNKSRSCDSEPTASASEQDQGVSPETENNETQIDGDPRSSGRSEMRARCQSLVKDGSDDQSGSETSEKQRQEAMVPPETLPAAASNYSEGESRDDDHTNSEDQKEFLPSVSADVELCREDEVNFPPPPPPVCFKEDTEVLETEKEASTSSSLPACQPANSNLNGDTDALSEADENNSTSDTSEQSQDKTNTIPSRFAQAVAIAVQRSRLQNFEKDSSSPHGVPQSTPRSTYQYARWSDNIQL